MKYDIIRETFSEPSRSQWLETVEAASDQEALEIANATWDDSLTVKGTCYLVAIEVVG